MGMRGLRRLAVCAALGWLLSACARQAGGPAPLRTAACAVSGGAQGVVPPAGATLHLVPGGRAAWVFSPGLILRTTDGGRQWCDVTPPPLVRGRPVPPTLQVDVADFVSGTQAWVAAGGQCTSTAQLLHTADGGRAWRPVQVADLATTGGAPLCVSRIDFLNPNDGWVLMTSVGVGKARGAAPVGVLYDTTDGGRKWAPASLVSHATHPAGTLPLAGTVEGVRLQTPTSGWATEGSAGTYSPVAPMWLAHTADGGAIWTAVSGVAVPPAYPYPHVGTLRVKPYAPRFFGSADGILPVRFSVFGAPTVWVFYRTTDGGSTWQAGTPVQGRREAAFAFRDALSGVLLQPDGTWLGTADAGRTWTPLPAPGPIGTVAFSSSATGWAITASGALYLTQNGGGTWGRQSLVEVAPRRAPWPLRAWRAAWRPAWGPLVAVTGHLGCFIWTGCGPGSQAAASGSACVRPPMPLLRRLWTAFHPRAPAFSVLDMVSPQQGWALAGGQLLHTTDGGEHWLRSSPGGCALSGLAVTGPGRLVAAAVPAGGGRVTILRTSNGGWRWYRTEVADAGTSPDPRLDFVSAADGFLLVRAGPAGREVLYRTTDGGARWTPVAGTLPAGAGQVRFSGPLDGWAVVSAPARSLTLYATRDGGRTWSPAGALGVDAGSAPAVTAWGTAAGGAALLAVAPAPGTAGPFSTVLYRTAGGGSWASTPPMHLDVIDAVGGQAAWAVSGTRLAYTFDGGLHWQIVYRGAALTGVRVLDFLSGGRQGWAVVAPPGAAGAPWTLLQTVDGGASWSVLDTLRPPAAAG